MLKVVEKTKKLVNKTSTNIAAAGAMATATVSGAFCTSDANAMMSSVGTLIANALKIGGVAMLAFGLVSVGKHAIAGDIANMPPGELGKSFGMIAVGVIMTAAENIIETITGVSLRDLTLVG